MSTPEQSNSKKNDIIQAEQISAKIKEEIFDFFNQDYDKSGELLTWLKSRISAISYLREKVLEGENDFIRDLYKVQKGKNRPKLIKDICDLVSVLLESRGLSVESVQNNKGIAETISNQIKLDKDLSINLSLKLSSFKIRSAELGRSRERREAEEREPKDVANQTNSVKGIGLKQASSGNENVIDEGDHKLPTESYGEAAPSVGFTTKRKDAIISEGGDNKTRMNESPKMLNSAETESKKDVFESAGEKKAKAERLLNSIDENGNAMAGLSKLTFKEGRNEIFEDREVPKRKEAKGKKYNFITSKIFKFVKGEIDDNRGQKRAEHLLGKGEEKTIYYRKYESGRWGKLTEILERDTTTAEQQEEAVRLMWRNVVELEKKGKEIKDRKRELEKFQKNEQKKIKEFQADQKVLEDLGKSIGKLGSYEGSGLQLDIKDLELELSRHELEEKGEISILETELEKQKTKFSFYKESSLEAAEILKDLSEQLNEVNEEINKLKTIKSQIENLNILRKRNNGETDKEVGGRDDFKGIEEIEGVLEQTVSALKELMGQKEEIDGKITTIKNNKRDYDQVWDRVDKINKPVEVKKDEAKKTAEVDETTSIGEENNANTKDASEAMAAEKKWEGINDEEYEKLSNQVSKYINESIGIKDNLEIQELVNLVIDELLEKKIDDNSFDLHDDNKIGEVAIMITAEKENIKNEFVTKSKYAMYKNNNSMMESSRIIAKDRHIQIKDYGRPEFNEATDLARGMEKIKISKDKWVRILAFIELGMENDSGKKQISEIEKDVLEAIGKDRVFGKKELNEKISFNEILVFFKHYLLKKGKKMPEIDKLKDEVLMLKNENNEFNQAITDAFRDMGDDGKRYFQMDEEMRKTSANSSAETKKGFVESIIDIIFAIFSGGGAK